MSSKEEILARIRQNTGTRYEKPDIAAMKRLAYPDKIEQFCAVSRAVGGTAVVLGEGEDVNAVIAQGLDVTTEFITQEEAQGRFDLKRLPEDASETVRIVKVGDYDECLCLGTHVKNTSEVGTFEVISHDWNEEAKRWRMRFKLQ
mgnify:CR=1 FL=1